MEDELKMVREQGNKKGRMGDLEERKADVQILNTDDRLYHLKKNV